MFSISFRKQRDEKKENNLSTLIKILILFAHAITTSTARASSVSPSSYTNTIFNQSARVLSYGCFLIVCFSPLTELNSYCDLCVIKTKKIFVGGKGYYVLCRAKAKKANKKIQQRTLLTMTPGESSFNTAMTSIF